MINGKEFLSSLKQYSDYLKYREEIQKYETWEQACEEVLMGHVKLYGKKVLPYVEEVLPSYVKKEVLASQRSLQFRYDSLMKHNAREYNCSVLYAYSPDMFKKGFYMLMCGCGLGVHVGKKYVSKVPPLFSRGTSNSIFNSSRILSNQIS